MICDHTKKTYPRRVLLIRILCFILGPIAPIIIFANYIYNREQEHFFKRELQTHGNLELDIGNDVEKEATHVCPLLFIEWQAVCVSIRPQVSRRLI